MIHRNRYLKTSNIRKWLTLLHIFAGLWLKWWRLICGSLYRWIRAFSRFHLYDEFGKFVNISNRLWVCYSLIALQYNYLEINNINKNKIINVNKNETYHLSFSHSLFLSSNTLSIITIFTWLAPIVLQGIMLHRSQQQ